jgi:hypothetical protein
MRTVRITKISLLLGLGLTIAACTNAPKGVRVINGGTSAVPTKQAAEIRNLTSAEIGPAVIGKTFQYTRTGASGFVTYNSDGTLTVQDDKKGATTGKWTTTGDQYCESYAPSLPMECGVFKFTGDAYFAANSHLVEMKT